jgi:uncharacterized protein YhaN
LNKTVDFATDRINEANSVISANGLDFNQPSGSGGSSHTTNNASNAITYEAGSVAELEAQYRKLEDELKNTNVSDERLKQIQSEKTALLQQIEALKIRNGLAQPKAEDSPEQKKRNSYKEAKNQIT